MSYWWQRTLLFMFIFSASPLVLALNLPIIRVISMYFALVIHYMVGYYACIDFTIQFVSSEILLFFFISPVMTTLSPAVHIDQFRKLRNAQTKKPLCTCCSNTSTSVSQCNYWFHWNFVLVGAVRLYSLAFYYACFLLSLASHPFSILCMTSFHTQTLCMLIAYFGSRCEPVGTFTLQPGGLLKCNT